MADLNFPNPGVQQTYTFVGKTWNWDGQRWAFASSGSGITKLNELTSSVQNFLIGYSGAFPNIVSSGTDHTFNFPIAGTAATGLVNTSDQTFAGAKTFASTTNATYIGVGGVVVHGGIAISGNAAIGGSAIFTNTSNTNTIAFRAGIQGSTLSYIFPIDTPTAGQVLSASAPSSGVVTLSWEDDQTGAPAGGITQLNGLTAATQSFQTGTAGVDFGISSTTATHTFNLPDASASARGVITTGTQTIAGAKTFSSSIVGNLTGTATTSENVNVTTTTRSLTHYLTFTSATSGSGLALTTSAVGIGFTVNPAQNTLAAGTFIGNLSGTAATATNFYGTLVGNSSTATTSQNINVNTTTAGGNFFLTFTNQSSGSGLALTTSTIGIGFTVNPAQNTLAAGTFIGNLSGTAATATNFYGTHIGNVTGTATTSQNVNVTTTTAGGNFYLTFTNQSSGSGLALTTSAIGIGFTVNPAQNTLAAGTFIGNLSGTAVTATNFYGTLTGNSSTATTSANINTVAATTGTGHYLLFSPVNGASGVAVSSDAQLQFSPSTNVLTVDVFSGNLSATGATVTSILDVQGDAALGNATGDTVTFNARIGSHINPSANTTYDLGLPTLRWRNVYLDNITGVAVTATNFYGTLVGNSSTATTSQNVNVNTTTAGGNFYLTFTNQSSGSGLALTTSTIGIGFTVNPAQNTLAAGTFIGNLSGTAATATNFYGTLVGNSSTATTSQNINVNTTTAGGNFFLTFTNQSSGSGLALTTSTIGIGFTVNPAQNTLAAGTFIGNLSGTAVTATNFFGSLTGNVTGTATTAQNVNLATGANNTNHSVVFSLNSSGTGVGLSSDASLLYNPSTNVLTSDVFSGNFTGTAATATNFYGTLTGNVTGTATTAQNLNTVAAATGTGHYLLFSPTNGGSGIAVSSDAQLQFSPATNVLTADIFSGNLSGTAATATNFYGTLVGNSSTATTSQNINVNTTTEGGNFYLTFTNQSSGSGLALTTSTIGIGFTVNPAQNTLAAGTFIGNLSGTAATTSFLKVTSTSGTALNIADRVTVHTANNSEGLNINSNYSYAFSIQDKSNNNRLIVDVSNSRTIFTGSSAAHEIRVFNNNESAYFGFKANSTGSITYILPPGGPSTGSSILQSDNLGNMIWVPMTSGLSSAITSINSQTGPSITLETGSSGSDFAISQSGNTITFNLPDASASNRGLVTNGTQTIAGSKTFSSTISGNLSGTATTSQNVNVTTTTAGGNFYLTFTNQSSGSGLALTTSAIGIGFTVNPAQNTLAAGTFIGNLSGAAVTATNFYGTLTGNSSTATTSGNINTVAATTGTGHYLLFSPVNGGSGVAVSSDAQLQFSPATNVLTVDTFSGNLSATAATATNFYGTLVGNSSTATTSQNVNTVAATTGTGHYLLFSPVNGGSGVAISSDAQLQFSPATNVLTVDIFSGNLSGTAATVTNFYGALTGNVTGTATTAQNVNTAAFTNNNVHYITFTLQGNGAGAALSTSNSSGKLTYRPSDEQLSVTNITGTAFTATNFYGTHVGAVTGNVTGTATTAQNLNTVAATTGTGHYLLFSPVNGGSGIAVSSDAQLQFSPATNVLTADTFSGNLSGTAATVTNFYGTLTGNVTGTATTAQNVNTNVYTNNSVHYLTFTLQGNGAGAALSTSNSAGKLTYRPADEQLSVTNITGTAFTATNFYGTHVGSVTGNVTGTATTAQNVNTVAATTGTGHYLLFSPVNGGSGVALSSDAQLQFSPSTNVLTVDTFSGNLSGTAATVTNFYGSLTGNVTGTATTAQNVNVTTTTAGGNFYLTFTNQSSGSGLALTTSTIGIGFTVNPAQNTLAAGTFIGNVSGSATTSTYITGILRNASYVLGDLLAGASTGNTLTRVPVGANNRYFLKPDSTTQSGLGWSTFAGVFVTSLAPASPAFTLVEGDLWYKVDDGSFNVYYDVDETAQWVEIVSSGGPGGGTATTSENVNVNTTTINQNHYLLFSNRSSGSGVALTTSTIGIGFTVNPAENSLSAGLFAGNISGTAATFANIYGNTFGSLTGVEFSGGDVLIKTGKSLKIYEANNVYNTSFKANSSLAGNTDYTLPVGKPGTGASILQSDTAGSMIWVKAASNKATYVLSFGAGFTPTTGLDSVSIAIPYANDGSTSLTYTIKRVEVRTETEPGASTLAFYFERHTAGNAIWTVTPITIKGAASANFSVAQNNYVSSFTTITSSSGNNGEVASGNYLRVNFASVGTAANVSISIMIQEN